MQMKVTCPNCGKELRAPQELRGKRVACPGCNEGFRVFEPPDHTEGIKAPDHVIPPPLNRPAQAAKFIAAQTAQTQVQLGADGRLPVLLFENRVAEPDSRETATRDSNPLLLIGVLCFSVTLSVLLLVFDPQQVQSNDAAKDEARHWIVTRYIGAGPHLKPHEKRLREALQAFHRGDFATERRMYRDVLDMLRDESHRGAVGLTGPRRALDPPNDHHLEQLLATLLSGD
jgi:DNA-directed RNA polymerase subunit RPC12/RpoP